MLDNERTKVLLNDKNQQFDVDSFFLFASIDLNHIKPNPRIKQQETMIAADMPFISAMKALLQ